MSFHINHKGKVGVCNAQSGNCPFGGSDRHFTTRIEAETHAYNEESKRRELLPTMTHNSDDKNNSDSGDKFIDTRGNKREIKRVITNPSEIMRYKGFENQTLHSRDDGVNNRLQCVNHDSKRVAYFEVDKKHRNGPEVHCLKEDGTILIYNKGSGRFITVFLARPGQLDTYIDDKFREDNRDEVNKMYKSAELNTLTKANKLDKDNKFSPPEYIAYNRVKQDILNGVDVNMSVRDMLTQST